MVTILSQRLLTFFTLLLCVGLLSTQSCAKYGSKSFNKLSNRGITKNNVTVTAHELSSKDSNHYFNADITTTDRLWFTSYPSYQAIQLTIKNDSNVSYILDTDRINLPLASCHEVSQKIYRINSYWLSKKDSDFYTLKNRIYCDIEARALDQNTTIAIGAHSSVNKFLFVPCDNAASYLAITLVNKKNGEKIKFEIDL